MQHFCLNDSRFSMLRIPVTVFAYWRLVESCLFTWVKISTVFLDWRGRKSGSGLPWRPRACLVQSQHLPSAFLVTTDWPAARAEQLTHRLYNYSEPSQWDQWRPEWQCGPQCWPSPWSSTPSPASTWTWRTPWSTRATQTACLASQWRLIEINKLDGE